MILKNILQDQQIEYSKYCHADLDIDSLNPIFEKDHLDLTVSELVMLAPIFLNQHYFFNHPKQFHASEVLNKILYHVGQTK